MSANEIRHIVDIFEMVSYIIIAIFTVPFFIWALSTIKNGIKVEGGEETAKQDEVPSWRF